MDNLYWQIHTEKLLKQFCCFYNSFMILPLFFLVFTIQYLHWLHHSIKIARTLNTYENTTNLRHIVVPVKDKFLDYLFDISIIYSFEFILDPRAKIRGFTKVLRIISNILGNVYLAYLTAVRAVVYDVFAKYENKFGDVKLRTATMLAPSSKKKYV